MRVQEQVVQCVQNWADVTVDVLSRLLCDPWLKNHTACDDPAFQLLLQQVRNRFPNRKIELVPADFLGESGTVKTVQNLVDAVLIASP
jgi:hypothetical protein